MRNRNLLGLLGENINYSFSPLIFNSYFRKVNLNYRYCLFPISRNSLSDFMKNLRKSSILGLNVTIPYKESAIPYLDKLEPNTRKISAINVIHNDKGKLTAYNTDYTGFKRALRKYDYLSLEKAVILGAGGAARSVIYALYTLNFKKIVFFSRNRKRINRIMSDFYFIKVLQGYLWDEVKIKAEIRNSDMLINATPVGMFPDENKTPIEIDFKLKDNFLVLDLIYNPRLTRLLKETRSRGALIENGIAMLIFQAMESLKIWSREIVNEELFIKTCEEVLNASIFNSRRITWKGINRNYRGYGRRT